MRDLTLGMLIGVGIGAVATLLLRPAAEGPPAGAPGRSATPPALDGHHPPGVALAGRPEADAALVERLASIEAELGRLREALRTLGQGARAPSTNRPSRRSGVTVTDPVEAIRRAWSQILDRNEEQLRPDAPRDGRTNPAYESYMMDIRHARRVLHEAETIDDLIRLSKEHPNLFTFD